MTAVDLSQRVKVLDEQEAYIALTSTSTSRVCLDGSHASRTFMANLRYRQRCGRVAALAGYDQPRCLAQPQVDR